VEDQFLARYQPRIVGGALHKEYWIPAADLDALNQAICPPIVILPP